MTTVTSLTHFLLKLTNLSAPHFLQQSTRCMILSCDTSAKCSGISTLRATKIGDTCRATFLRIPFSVARRKSATYTDKVSHDTTENTNPAVTPLCRFSYSLLIWSGGRGMDCVRERAGVDLGFFQRGVRRV